MEIRGINFNEVTVEGHHFIEYNGQYYTGCARCGGNGQYSYNGEHSRCYTCDNVDSLRLGKCVGTLDDAAATATRRNRDHDRREAKRAAEVQKHLQELEDAQERVSAHIREFLNTNREDRYAFIVAMYNQMNSHHHMVTLGGFTPRQVETIERIITERAAEDAKRAELGRITEGRYTVEGTVTSVRDYDGEWGTAWKMLVTLDDGHKIFGTIPSAIFDAVGPSELVGKRVTFDATVKASDRDETFGTYKRPTKASVK